MKHFYLLTLFSIFSLFNSYGQNSSEKLPGINGGNFFSIVEFQDTLYTITIDSEIFTSADDGATWVKDERFNQG